MTSSRTVLRTSVLAVTLVLLLGLLPSPIVGAEAPSACVEGFDVVDSSDAVLPAAVLTTSATSALVAGRGRTSGGQWAVRIVRYDGAEGWHTIVTRIPSSNAGLVAIDGDATKGRWAVGYTREDTDLLPYSLRQLPDGRWKEVRVPRAGSTAAAITDVAVRRRDAVWAVGYRLDGVGTQRPHVVRWNGKRWQVMSPAVARGQLTAVSSTRSGGTWIAGSVTRSRVERPYIARRVGGAWKSLKLPAVGAGSISAIMVQSRTAGWAVGYRVGDGRAQPLVFRWNGTSWQKNAPPDLSGETVLFDVDLDDGVVELTGATWDSDGARMRPIVARRRGTSWEVSELKGFEDDAVMTDVDGARSDRGFLSAFATTSGALVRTCDGTGVGVAARRSTRQARRAELAPTSDAADHPDEPRPSPRLGLAAAPKLRVLPRSVASVSIVDRAEAAGLRTSGATYGAVIRDFDGNGDMDIFLGGHGSPATLYLNEDGAFTDSGVDFGIADRHGCTATDSDGSGLPDLYCSYGGGGGFGLKANDLWLDPGGSDPGLAPDAGGARELLGRGRVATVIDYDDDGHKDLMLGQTPNRVDGLPSLNRVYRWTGPGRYRLVRDPGIEPAIGARELDTGDFDRDGRTDLLMVAFDPKADGPLSSIRLYRNTRKGFKAVQAARGIKSIGERDAELVGLDSDDRLDLIQLSANRIRVSLQRDGHFRKVWERKTSRAKALAVGDADGDGDNDIYILRYKDGSGVDDNDVILFNRGNGRAFDAVEAPSLSGGSADEVYPIDHDGNGTTDFLVLNGMSGQPGPIQLIAFYEP